jgi:anti-sigma B factor antagonist
MSNFSVGFRTNGSIQILELNGELDAHTASELEAAIQKCRDSQNHFIVVNGQNLQYISSAGLGVFMAYIEDVRDQGGDIKIAALQPRVYNVFDLLGFPMLFDIVDSEEDAISRFQSNGG